MRERWAENFADLACAYWTEERTKKLLGSKTLPLMPGEAPVLLRALGLLFKDATMPPKQVRKYRQINHMLAMLRPALRELTERFNSIQILDAGCGRSYLTMLIAWWFEHAAKHPVQILGIDRNPAVIDASKRRAEAAGLTSIRFLAADIHRVDLKKELPHLHAVISLHACDTATDDAIALAIEHRAAFVAVAPCCQRELSAIWAEQLAEHPEHPMAGLWGTPHLRRSVAATITDNYRQLLLRAAGYEALATEFVEALHTPKNTLIRAMKRCEWEEEAFARYCALRDSMGGEGIGLEQQIQGFLKGHFSVF